MDGITFQIIQCGLLMLLASFVMLFSKWLNDTLTPYSIHHELTTEDNVALSISLCGYFIATAIIFVGAMLGPSVDLMTDLTTDAGYSLLGIILLNLSRIINDKLILSKFCNVKEIIEDKNAGTGVVQFGSYIASGLIVAGAVQGEGGGVVTALAFFAMGQIALVIFTWIYNLITPYDIHDEIEKNNVAAGIGFAGALIAQGVILMKGASGNFIGWQHNITIFAMDAALIIILIPFVRFVVDKLVIPGADLNKEIKDDKNIGAGLLEMTASISFAIILFFTF